MNTLSPIEGTTVIWRQVVTLLIVLLDGFFVAAGWPADENTKVNLWNTGLRI